MRNTGRPQPAYCRSWRSFIRADHVALSEGHSLFLQHGARGGWGTPILHVQIIQVNNMEIHKVSNNFGQYSVSQPDDNAPNQTQKK